MEFFAYNAKSGTVEKNFTAICVLLFFCIDKNMRLVYNIYVYPFYGFYKIYRRISILSYKEDLKNFRDERKKRRKLLSTVIKVTVVVLAVVFAAAAVMLIVDLADGGSGNGGYSSVSGGASNNKVNSTGSLSVKLKGNADKIYVYLGGTVAWKNQIEVTGNGGTYTVKVNNSNVNLNKEGTYTVLYTVTDASNKTAKLKATVKVYKTTYSKDDLMTVIGKKVNELGITSSMSKSEQVRKVYEYAHNASNIALVGESNIVNINRADWNEDWIDEAMLTFNSKQGDCYSYYSVSKAFFEYLGIENIGIQRDNSNIPSSEGTHFWLMVNVGTDTDAKWYYYDATRLGGKFSDGSSNACLITLAKLQSYKPSKDLGFDFYEFNPENYPTAEKE